MLDMRDVGKISFSLPPLPEQKKIASILTSADEVIEKTQSQIKKLQDLKKGTMNELLTKGIGHKEFKDSEIIEMGLIMAVLVGVTKMNFALDIVEKEDYCPF